MKEMYQLKAELQMEAPEGLGHDGVAALWLTWVLHLARGLGFPTEVMLVETVALLPEPDIDKHLARYLANTEKRTGQKWEVVERYHTPGGDWNDGYDRALLRAEDGSTIRIYYREYRRCWVMGQKVLKLKEVADGE